MHQLVGGSAVDLLRFPGLFEAGIIKAHGDGRAVFYGDGAVAAGLGGFQGLVCRGRKRLHAFGAQQPGLPGLAGIVHIHQHQPVLLIVAAGPQVFDMGPVPGHQGLHLPGEVLFRGVCSRQGRQAAQQQAQGQQQGYQGFGFCVQLVFHHGFLLPVWM